MKTRLAVQVDYDPDITDPEGLASAMDRLFETALSTPGIRDDYGNPTVGPFLVAEANGPMYESRPRVMLNIHEGVVQDACTLDPESMADARYVLYNLATDELASRSVYGNYQEAVEAASQFHDKSQYFDLGMDWGPDAACRAERSAADCGRRSPGTPAWALRPGKPGACIRVAPPAPCRPVGTRPV